MTSKEKELAAETINFILKESDLEENTKQRIDRCVKHSLEYLVENSTQFCLFNKVIERVWQRSIEQGLVAASTSGINSRLQIIVKTKKRVEKGKIVFQSPGKYAHIPFPDLLDKKKSLDYAITDEGLQGATKEERAESFLLLKDMNRYYKQEIDQMKKLSIEREMLIGTIAETRESFETTIESANTLHEKMTELQEVIEAKIKLRTQADEGIKVKL